MTPELYALAFAAILQSVQFALMAIPVNLELGFGKTLGPRDPERLGKPLVEQASAKSGRLIRAMDNHFEALILFTIAVVVTVLGDRTTGFSAICAWVYLGARVLYIPAYYFGFAPWRSLIWFVGFLATMAMICAALVF